MGRHDWYRNTTWDAEIEAAFFERLARSKSHSVREYLSIQGGYLTATYPEVALRLLDQSLSLGTHANDAMAHAARAAAYVTLGQIAEAVSAYEDALTCQKTRPSVRTRADLLLPRLIATHRLVQHYPRAWDLHIEAAPSLQLPIEWFIWRGTRALLFHAYGLDEEARRDAGLALEAASATTSGLPRRPTLGLVGSQDDDFWRRINAIAHGTEPPDLTFAPKPEPADVPARRRRRRALNLACCLLLFVLIAALLVAGGLFK